VRCADGSATWHSRDVDPGARAERQCLRRAIRPVSAIAIRTRAPAADFLRRLIERVPYTIHTVLTDNGFQFTPPHGGWTVAEIHQRLATHQPFRAHAFDFACAQLRIEHRLTKFKHPWTNGQANE
jgi:hypothetical protein